MQQFLAEKRPFGKFGVVLVVVLGVVTLLVGAKASADDDEKSLSILVQGAPLVGSANGMFFDPLDRLFVANVFGQSISVLNPDSGDILFKLGPAVGVFAPDDLTITPDGSLFWTDPVFGFVGGLPSTGGFVLPAIGFPSANPITVSDDGRLFFAQCFNFGPEGNGIFEADPMGIIQPPRIIRQGDPGCASNGMDWWDGFLYSPRWFEGRVVRVDVDTGELTNVTTGWFVPAAVKFDSMGRLHAVSQGTGEVVRIDLATGDRTLLAQLPIGLDNLAFDSMDRLFVSSATDASVVEILDDGSVRTVSPGGMNIALGLELIDDVVHVSGLQTLRSFDADDGEAVGLTRSIAGFGPLPFIPFAVSSLGDNLVLLDSLGSGLLAIWNIDAEEVELTAQFALPADAEAFHGGLAVSELVTGSVVLASGADLSERTTLASGLIIPTGLAANRSNLYVAEYGTGLVKQIVRKGEVLAIPQPIAGGHVFNGPEGIALLSPNKMVVVEGLTGSLKEVHLRTGRVKTLAEGLEFFQGGPPFAFQFLNDVEVDKAKNLYINGDAANVIYKFGKVDDDDDSDSD